MKKKLLISIVVIVLVLTMASTALAETATYSGSCMKGWTSYISLKHFNEGLCYENCSYCYYMNVHEEIQCYKESWFIGINEISIPWVNTGGQSIPGPLPWRPMKAGEIHLYLKNYDHYNQIRMYTGGSFYG